MLCACFGGTHEGGASNPADASQQDVWAAETGPNAEETAQDDGQNVQDAGPTVQDAGPTATIVFSGSSSVTAPATPYGQNHW